MTRPPQVRTVHPVCHRDTQPCRHEGVVEVFPGPIITMGPDPIDWVDVQERANDALAMDLGGEAFTPPPVWVGNGAAPWDPAVLVRHDPVQEPFPAPAVTSDLIGPVQDIKTPVINLATKAEAMGWTTHITYAEGHAPHSTTGRPGPRRPSLAVRMRHSAYGAVAVYVGGSSSWSWDFMYLWGPDLSWQKHKTQAAFLDGLSMVTARIMVKARLRELGIGTVSTA